ncbi:DUF6415 family natural product biosynthesis protein [Streptomyces sp. NPDC096013]|uniref:DUF6415 family natural product biosynthesis protein n=1 Tax=Streptomyces sp. NPDC096013 TaxID=3366069 RepID=UPI0037F129EC
MRTSVAVLLAADIPRADPADPESRSAPELRFSGPELVALADTYRGHVRVLIQAVEARAKRLPERHADRVTAMMCTGRARMLLRGGTADNNAVQGAVADRLARSVQTLCGHYDRLVSR